MSGTWPKFNIKIPQLIEDLFKQCVDADPSKWPTANNLFKSIDQWCGDDYDSDYDENSEIYKQAKEADEFNKNQPTFTKSSNNTELTYETHPQAIYTSRLLNFNKLPEPKNADYVEYSGKLFNINYGTLLLICNKIHCYFFL